MPPFTRLRSTRTPIRIESAEYLCETRRKVFEKVIPAPVGVIPSADVVPAHYSIPPGACSRSALRTYLFHIRAPIPFHCAGALRDRTPVTGYNTPTAHFRNRRCLAKCRRRLGRASRSSPRRKPPPRVPNRQPRFPTSSPPPRPSTHPSGFSIRSQQDSASFNPRLSWLPFVPPSPRSSIPESTHIVPQNRICRLSET